MAESRFTPGPWVVLHDPNVPRSKRIGVVGKHLCVVSSSWMPLAEIEANAELMADAPALLEALRELFASTIGDPMEDRHVVKKAYADVERLLEKHGG